MHNFFRDTLYNGAYLRPETYMFSIFVVLKRRYPSRLCLCIDIMMKGDATLSAMYVLPKLDLKRKILFCYLL